MLKTGILYEHNKTALFIIKIANIISGNNGFVHHKDCQYYFW